MSLSMRFLPRYPSKIIGAAGISTDRSGPDVVISSDYNSLVRIPAVDNPATAFFKVWNQDNDSYSIMTFDDVIVAIGDVTGVMAIATYDPQGIEADAFDRANHTGEQAISTVTGLQAAIDAKAPVSTTVTLTGAQTLTNKTLTSPALNTPTLILKQSATPTPTAEGDMQWDTDDNALVVGDGAGQKIFRPNVWTLVGDYTPSAVSALNVTDLSAYRAIRIHGHVYPSVTAGVFIRTSTDNGATYDSAASDYPYQSLQALGATVSTVASAGTAFSIAGTTGIVSGANSGVQFDLVIDNFNKASQAKFLVSAGALTSGDLVTQQHGRRANSTARNAFSLFPGAGTMSGYVTVEGIRG